MTCVLFAGAVGLGAASALGQPVITVTSGTWSQGDTVNISGSGFGDTGDEEPIKFDDFESGVVGASLGTGGWSVTCDNGPDVPEFSSTKSWSGSKCGYCDITMGGDSAAYITGANTTSFYVSLMFHYHLTESGSTSKGVRVHSNDDDPGENVYTTRPGVYIQDFHSSNRHTILPYDDSSGKVSDYSPGNFGQDTWMRLEYWFKMSVPAGATNGEVKLWKNLSLDSSWTGMTRGSGVSEVYNLAMLPFYYGNGSFGYHWYDDVYISRSKARVEIGNASTWSGCTRREIQGVTSWSAGSIDIQVNAGAFADPTDGYLYVVDANGVANQQGFWLGGPPTFTLAVTNGSGAGEYEQGTVVAISADPAPSGKLFAVWVGDIAYIADRLQADTTVTMPTVDVSLTAAYAWGYTLTVNSGSGSGLYFSGAVVDIMADAPPTGRIFEQWAGDVSYVGDVYAATTTFDMPGLNCEVTATLAIPYIPGDLDRNGIVGQGDLDIVLDNWGDSPPADPRADPSGDGWVGQGDLDIVLDNWGQSI